VLTVTEYEDGSCGHGTRVGLSISYTGRIRPQIDTDGRVPFGYLAFFKLLVFI
jgi:hypothetical protein